MIDRIVAVVSCANTIREEKRSFFMHNLPSDFAEDSHFNWSRNTGADHPDLYPKSMHLESKKCFGLHERDREPETQARRLATLNSALRCPSGMSNYHQNTTTVFSIDQHRYSQSKLKDITGV
jgi:hypothetical protein